MSNLTDRIALILQAEAASDAIAAILDDARVELEAANEACADAKARVLDPLSTTAAVTKAKKELEDQTLAASRLETAIARLSDQLEAARDREAQATAAKLYSEAKAERDALEKAILETYSDYAKKIASLLMQIDPVDQKVAVANQARSAETPHLGTVGRSLLTVDGWNLCATVRLPALAAVGVPDSIKTDPYQRTIWPVGRGL